MGGRPSWGGGRHGVMGDRANEHPCLRGCGYAGGAQLEDGLAYLWSLWVHRLYCGASGLRRARGEYVPLCTDARVAHARKPNFRTF